MEKNRARRRTPPHGGAVTGALALLLVICLAECASGSCLSYGHSCWGAHGKRSGKPPLAAPDWFINKLLHRFDANVELSRARMANNDVNAIYPAIPDETPSAEQLGPENEEPSLEIPNRNPEAKPMLDDNLLAKIKFWRIMREATDEK